MGLAPKGDMRHTDVFHHFSQNQRHALDGCRNLAVRANAGSGKTSVLVERVVQILARSWDRAAPLKLAGLLVLTFTRKAAAELQERLRDSFLAMRHVAGGVPEAAYWDGLIEELPGAAIGTIDSFCARVLREFGYQAGGSVHIEPDFEPLDEYDELALKREAVERVINRLGSLPPWEKSGPRLAQAEACRWWGEEQGYDSLARHLLALLNHIVDPPTILAAHAGLPSAAERVAAAWARLPAVARLTETRDELLAQLQALSLAVAGQKRPGQRLTELADGLKAVLAALAAGGRDANEQALRRLRDTLCRQDGTPRTQGLSAVQPSLQPLQDAWCPLLETFDFDAAGEVCALEAADRLARLLEPVHAEYLQLCHQEKRYDFLTLARRTRDLLRESAAVRAALRDRFRSVMIDEFQDTNQLQWEILAAVVRDEEGTQLDTDRLFIVGDPQQSIYRFRHADVGVFRRVQEAIRASNLAHGRDRLPTDYDLMVPTPTSSPEQRLGLMPLGENYRTLAPMPLGLLDRVFQYVFDPVVHRLDLERCPFEVVYQRLEAGRPPAERAAWGEIRYVIPADEEAEKPAPEASSGAAEEEVAAPDALGRGQVRAVVDQLVALRGQPRRAAGERETQAGTLSWRNMAVLLPSRSVVLTELEQEFRRRGVPFVVTRGIGFWQRQEVRDLVSLAAALADPGDELALFAVLRGPLGQRTDTELIFLSQLGRGSLAHGLRMIAGAGNDLAAPEGPAEERTWAAERWRQLPDRTRAALAEYWQSAAHDNRAELRRTAAALRRWWDRVDRMPHADLLQRALEESGAYALYAAEPEGEQILANLRRLFDLIRELESRSAPGLARLARRLCALVDEALTEEQATVAPGADAVQVMTVHAAKGLEFPVVAVMKLERRADRAFPRRLMVKSPWDELLRADAAQHPDARPGTIAVAIRHPLRPRETYTPPLLHALRKLDRAQELAESRRLFYVAATRARERLILAGRQFPPSRKVPESWQKWFEEALQLSDRHKQQGHWEDAATGFRVNIVTAASEGTPVAGPSFQPPTHAVDLQPMRETPPARVLGVATLVAMRAAWKADRRDWWLRYGLQLAPEFQPPAALARALVPALMQQFLILPPAVLRQPTDSWDGRLAAMAGNLLRTGRFADAMGGTDPANAAAVVREGVATARTLLAEICRGRTDGRRIRQLATADGEPDVPFAVMFGPCAVTGHFPRLLHRPGGCELLAWTFEPVATVPADVRLQALALHRAGRAALADGKVPCQLVYLPGLQVQTVALAPGELEGFADEVRHDLDAMAAFAAGQSQDA